MPRLEKVDRDRVRKAIESAGGYVRVNYGGAFTGKTGRADLQGVNFLIELKREDTKDPWEACTEKQKLELRAFAAAGGRSCTARLEKNTKGGWNVFGNKIGEAGSISTFDFDLMFFVHEIRSGEGWL